MLLISRFENQSLVIDEEIEVKIVRIDGNNVCLGITAPKNKSIHKKEYLNKIKNLMMKSNND